MVFTTEPLPGAERDICPGSWQWFGGTRNHLREGLFCVPPCKTPLQAIAVPKRHDQGLVKHPNHIQVFCLAGSEPVTQEQDALAHVHIRTH